ncbi:MAG: ABC-F family ATP-binding cassette domain-containing protein, partial [Pseudomonadota bacterium]
MLQINQLTLRIAGRILLDQATAVIDVGDRVGLVGRNGAGKSSLLRAILGELPWDSGEIIVPPRWTLGTIEQEPPTGSISLLDAVLAADKERTALEKEAETATDPNRIAEIHTRLADIGAHSAPARAASILAGLGFGQEAIDRPCASLSGGQRMRISLARLLFRAPDVLLLDEPTNHLDLDAALWLEGFLATYSGAILVVSHDRPLLNNVAKRIVHLNDRRLRNYAGGYDRFERTRRELLARQSVMHTRQQAEKRRLQAFVDRFRYKATKAKQAQSRLKMIARMEPIAAVMEEHSIGFDFPKPEPLSPPLIRLDGV